MVDGNSILTPLLDVRSLHFTFPFPAPIPHPHPHQSGHWKPTIRLKMYHLCPGNRLPGAGIPSKGALQLSKIL